MNTDEENLRAQIHRELGRLGELQAPPTLAQRVLRKVQERESLDRTLDGFLKSVGDVPAPPTLIRRVLDAIAAREARPWWNRSYNEWPAGARWTGAFASATVVGLVLGAAWIGWANGGGIPGEVLAAVRSQFQTLNPMLRAAAALVSALGAAAQALGPWFFAGVAAVFAAMYAVSLGLGLACYRIAVGSASPSSRVLS